MALIIEDGSVVPGAESVATVAEARTYAGNRGLVLPTLDADVEILLRKGMDYIQSIEGRFSGRRFDTDTGQPLLYPRENVYVFDIYIGQAIPQQLKDGQCQLAVDAVANNLLAPGTGREVIEEQLGPMRTKYNPSGNPTPQYEPTAALAIFGPLLKASGSPINLFAAR